MTARLVLRIVLLAAALALGTVVAGWWALPVLGAVWGLINGGRRWVGSQTIAAGALAWGALLWWTATVGPFALLVSKTSAIMGLPPAVLFALTVLFGGLAAGSAAGFVASTVRSRAG